MSYADVSFDERMATVEFRVAERAWIRERRASRRLGVVEPIVPARHAHPVGSSERHRHRRGSGNVGATIAESRNAAASCVRCWRKATSAASRYTRGSRGYNSRAMVSSRSA